MKNLSNILIIGAGWRVQEFILPALIMAGCELSKIILLRRTEERLPPPFDQINILTNLKDAPTGQTLIFNCAPAAHMLDIQKQLCLQFPEAIHLCDTPTNASGRALLRAMADRTMNKVFSLEDWPFMPNINLMNRAAMHTPSALKLTVSYIGIPNHFFSLARTIHTDKKCHIKILRKNGHAFSIGKNMHFIGPKKTEEAQISAHIGPEIYTDHFTLNATDQSTLKRYITPDEYRLELGEDHNTPPYPAGKEIRALFEFDGSRKSIHHLDKVIALYEMLMLIKKDKHNALYSLDLSLRDIIVGRIAHKLSYSIF